MRNQSDLPNSLFNEAHEAPHRRAAILRLCAHPETRWWDWTFDERISNGAVVAVTVAPTLHTERVRCN